METKWTVSDTSNAKYLGTHEFQDDKGEWHDFEILETSDRLVFGGACNVGLLESGYMLKNEDESTDEALSELFADLEVFYNDGARYVSRIVCNERM
jgi:hypothetical protein